MSALLYAGLANAAVAAVLAVAAHVISRRCKRPSLAHSLWLLVLLKLLTPPLLPLPVAWLPAAELEAPPTPQSETQARRAVEAQPIVFANLVEPQPADEAPTLAQARERQRAFAAVSRRQGEARTPAGKEIVTVRTVARPAGSVPGGVKASTALPTWSVPWYELLLFAWLAGALLWFARAAVHVIRFQRLLRHARPAPAEVQDQADALARRMGLSRCPQVCVLPGPIPPLVWAAVGPVRIFFPAQLLDRLGPEERASLLAHELAHVCRRDHWVRWLELIVVGVYWWYPLVWWVRNRLQAHEEECCDAWVSGQMSPRSYASAILKVVDFLSEYKITAPAMASGLARLHALKRRLTLIMGGRTPRGLNPVGWALVLGLGLILLPVLPTLGRTDPKPAPVVPKVDKREGKEKPRIDRKIEAAPDGGEPGLTFNPQPFNLFAGDHAIFSVAASPDGRIMASSSGFLDRPSEIRLWSLGPTRRELARIPTRRGATSLAFAPDGQRLAAAGFDRLAHVYDILNGGEAFALELDGPPRLAWSPDGKRLATVTKTGTAKLWDAFSGKEITALEGERTSYYCVAFSPNGQRLAAAGGDPRAQAGRLVVWDLESRKQVLNVESQKRQILSLAYSPDGVTLACGSVDSTIVLRDAATGRQKTTLIGHPFAVEAAAFSPDGKTLVSGGSDPSVRIWDVASGRVIRELDDHAAPVRALALTPDGKFILTGDNDRALKMWDAATGRVVETLLSRDDRGGDVPPLLSVAAAADGKTLALAGEDGVVQLREVSTGTLRFRLKGHTDKVTCVAFTPDGNTLVSGSPDKTVRVWDAASGREKFTLNGHTSWVYAVAVSPDGKTLASAGYDKVIRLWDLKSQKAKATLPGHSAAVRALAFSRDGKLLASGGSDKIIKLWDIDSLKEASTLSGHTATVRALAFAPDGSTLASAGEDGAAFVWDVQQGKVRLRIADRKGEALAVVFSPRGRYLAVTGAEGTINVWDVTGEGASVAVLRGHEDAVTGAVFLDEGRRLATVGLDRSVKIWQAQPGAFRIFRGHTGPVKQAVFSPDGKYILSCGGWPDGDKTLRLWDVSAGRELRRFEGHQGQVLCVAFLPDGQRALSGGDDKTLRLWDVSSGKQLMVLTGHDGDVNAVTISRDGRLALSGSTDRTARLWDLKTGETIRKLNGHQDVVRSVALTPDGKQALTGSRDGKLRLWNLDDGKEVRSMDTPREWVETVSLSPDGKKALTGGGGNGVMRVWDLDSGREQSRYPGHDYGVTSVAFAPDGRSFLSTSYDGSVRWWDPSGRERARFVGHTDFVWSVAFDPLGRFALSAGGGAQEGDRFVAGRDFTLRMWSLADAAPTMRGPNGGSGVSPPRLSEPQRKPDMPGAAVRPSAANSRIEKDARR